MLWFRKSVLVLTAALIGVAFAADPWSYRNNQSDQAGPSKWKSFYPDCDGNHQSPVNIKLESDSIMDLRGTTKKIPIKFSGKCEKFDLKTLEDVYKWEFKGDTDCKATLQVEDNNNYTLAQFHVHTPSEHTINGYHYNGEIHFVHKEDGGSKLLVVGLLLNAEKDVEENAWLEKVWHTLSKGDENKSVSVDLKLNYVDLLNGIVKKSHLFNYSGSLTTPPCSEIVNWWIINNPLSISPSEFKRLREAYEDRPAADNGHDNRPTQDLNDRKIKYY